MLNIFPGALTQCFHFWLGGDEDELLGLLMCTSAAKEIKN